MTCVPGAVALPTKLSGRVFRLQPLDNMIEFLSYGADCPPPLADDVSWNLFR